MSIQTAHVTYGVKDGHAGKPVMFCLHTGAVTLVDFLTADQASGLGSALVAKALEIEQPERIEAPDPITTVVRLPNVDAFDRALGEGRR